jgi:DNA-binding FrmR family transcriptional regulator
MQYRAANDALSVTRIDPDTGRLSFADTNAVATAHAEPGPFELVVIIQLGRSPRGDDLGSAQGYDRAGVYAEIRVDGQVQGRSYPLSDTAYLKYTTDQILALRLAAKTATRIVLKESIAIAVAAKNNNAAGDLTRLILIGLLERPDVRRWETLPRWLQVARVPCPPDLTSYDVVLKNSRGQVHSTHTITEPIQRRGRTYVSLFRDLPRPAAAVTPE